MSFDTFLILSSNLFTFIFTYPVYLTFFCGIPPKKGLMLGFPSKIILNLVAIMSKSFIRFSHPVSFFPLANSITRLIGGVHQLIG